MNAPDYKKYVFIHQRISYFKLHDADEESYLQTIRYTLTEDNLIDILEINNHPIDKNGIIGESITKFEPNINMKVAAVEILINDGVFN